MARIQRLLASALLLAAAALAMPAFAECGGSTQCISIGLTPGQADTNHHGGGSATFTMAFGSQAAGTTSASQVAYVAAVTGPAGTMANLGNISIEGPDASSFLIAGGSCSDANGPVHGGAQCTINIAFAPVSPGPKSATVQVPLDPPICAGCITGRSFTVTGTGTEGPPVITSAPSANGTVGAPFTYRITATNNPTSFGATGLPAGLTVDAGGLISGTPTAAGTFTATVTATNAAGTGSSPLTITIVVGIPPPTVRPLSVTVPFETPTAIDLAGAVSGNYTSVALVTRPNNGLVTLAGTVATYTPATGFSGADSFTFTATGPGGTSAPATVSITVTQLPPTAGPAAMTVQINTTGTLDLRPFLGGGAATRVAIREQAQRGFAEANGTVVTYAPNRDVFGADRFTYVAIGPAGTSAPATVTVTIVGRPDPTRDAAVTGLLESQGAAAQRFSATQIDNLQRRMESLHRGAPPHGRRLALAPALASLASAGSLDLATLGNGGTAAGRTNFWIAGTAQFGRREAGGTLAGLDFTTSGVTLGFDRRLGPRLVVGAALGAARDETDIGTDGTRSRATGYSGAAYASFQPTTSTYIDALVGGGRLDFDSRRFAPGAGAFAEADRDGSQVFASLAAGYEHRGPRGLLSPYARIDWSRDRIDAATESGAAPYALAYDGQSASWVRGAAGVRAEATVETRFGWTRPRARLEWQRHFRGERTTRITYADLPGDAPFTFATRTVERNTAVLGLGVDFVFRGGLTAGIDYRLQRSGHDETDQAIRLNLSQELAGTGSLAWLEGLFLPVTRPLDIQLDAGFTYHDNVTRALNPADQRIDRSFGVNARKVIVRPWGANVRGVFTASLGGEKFQYHNGLSFATAGVKGEMQYRPSADFGAPTWSLFAQAATEQYESRQRDGERYTAGASVRVPLTDRLGLFGTLFRQHREARDRVFEGTQDGARLNIDWAFGRDAAFYAALEYRRGDHFTSANPAFRGAKHDGEHLPLAASQAVDDAFRNPSLTTARFDGRSWSATLGYNVALGPRDALDFSWRRIRSKPDNDADVVIGFYVPEPPVRYEVDQFMILYLLSF